jgi:hypothetical protein
MVMDGLLVVRFERNLKNPKAVILEQDPCGGQGRRSQRPVLHPKLMDRDFRGRLCGMVSEGRGKDDGVT